MRESKTLEFKESVTNTFLKTVSAFANYGTGEILFEVRDDGSIKGVDSPTQTCLDIENRINDSIKPVPRYSLAVDDDTSIIRLKVEEGLNKPYLYKSKAYRRNDTTTIEVDRLELNRLILQGSDAVFEELPAKRQDLEFHALTEKLQEILGVETVNTDTLKTLELLKNNVGVNIAGELFADSNDFHGIDIVRFGDSINIILDRATLANESILKQYDEALEFYRKYYQYEQIEGAYRKTVALIPEEAYREAIANALVHRTWDVKAHINVAMFSDRIEITSPGGLPEGMNAEDYYRGGISILRNRIIGNIFYRLHMIERFGTGVRRIKEAYEASEVKPIFEACEKCIRIVLPVFQEQSNLTKDERKIYSLVKGRVVTSSTLVAETGFGKSKVVTILKKLARKGYIKEQGNGRGRKYKG